MPVRLGDHFAASKSSRKGDRRACCHCLSRTINYFFKLCHRNWLWIACMFSASWGSNLNAILTWSSGPSPSTMSGLGLLVVAIKVNWWQNERRISKTVLIFGIMKMDKLYFFRSGNCRNETSFRTFMMLCINYVLVNVGRKRKASANKKMCWYVSTKY